MHNLSKIRLKIIGSNDSIPKLVRHFSARGKTRQEALIQARTIRYSVAAGDTQVTFAPGFSIAPSASFRGQEIQLYLYLPEGQKFRLDESMEELLPSYYFDRESRNNLWVLTNDKMTCLSCTEENKEIFTYAKDRSWEHTTSEDDEADRYFDAGDAHEWFGGSEDTRNFSIEGFSGIDASGMYTISINKGDFYKVRAYGNGRLLEDLDIHQDGKNLKIAMEDHHWWWTNNKKIKIEIECPHLEYLELSGATKSVVRGFTETDFRAKLSGASSARLDISTSQFELYTSGASKVELRGEADHAEVTMKGASGYNGYRFKIKNADFTISGASSSEIFASEQLRIEATGVSKVRYKGHPHLVKDLSGLGKISAEED